MIATEILGLTKMNWNSFDLYSKLPATIQTSNKIDCIGWLLNRFEGKTYYYRNFMYLNEIHRRRIRKGAYRVVIQK